MLSKYKENTDEEFATVYFNSITKTENGLKYSIEESFQEVFNSIDNLISEESGWTIESIDAEYVNVFIYNPLSRSLSIDVPDKLKKSKKSY